MIISLLNLAFFPRNRDYSKFVIDSSRSFLWV